MHLDLLSSSMTHHPCPKTSCTLPSYSLLENCCDVWIDIASITPKYASDSLGYQVASSDVPGSQKHIRRLVIQKRGPWLFPQRHIPKIPVRFRMFHKELTIYRHSKSFKCSVSFTSAFRPFWEKPYLWGAPSTVHNGLSNADNMCWSIGEPTNRPIANPNLYYTHVGVE